VGRSLIAFFGRRTYCQLHAFAGFHSVSPCYKYRHGLPGETDEQYVVRLAAELEAKFQELGPGTVAAFFLEPIVGASTGCTPSVPGYLLAMREVCDRHGALLCFDEVGSSQLPSELKRWVYVLTSLLE